MVVASGPRDPAVEGAVRAIPASVSEAIEWPAGTAVCCRSPPVFAGGSRGARTRCGWCSHTHVVRFLPPAQAATGKFSSSDKESFRAALVNVLERKMFYVPAFKIYGGVAGFFDYGPPGCAIKQNVTQFWRHHFVLEENMLEIECPAVTPEPVLRASGHVDRFTDFMVTDVETGDCHRADHLLENILEAVIDADPADAAAKDMLVRVGEMSSEELDAALKLYDAKAPETGNAISSAYPFNLMFKTSIGPRGDMVGYLRPETAQGIFVNFKELYNYNSHKLPFAAAQIGNSYRNEINPRAGLLRVREFTQAEIEHFVHPDDKRHPKFKYVGELDPFLYSRDLQLGTEKKSQRMLLRRAVDEGVIANETLAYFIGRTYEFCLKIGLNPDRVRFRQHLQHEMAHYAEDCWDCEVETSYGWVECAGLADRSAYDLSAHEAASKQDLAAYEVFPEPRMVEVVEIVPDKKMLGKELKRDAQPAADALCAMSDCDAMEMNAKLDNGEEVPLEINGKMIAIKREWVQITKKMKKISGRHYTPGVIEPSFGIGRFLYCMFEHCYYVREGDEQRTVFKFTPLAAPIKTTVLPLMSKPELTAVAEEIGRDLRFAGVSNTVDSSAASVGKRYARNDEIGVPMAITIDYETLEDAVTSSVTLRDRDTTAQVRVPRAEIVAVVKNLAEMKTTWEVVYAQYPVQESTEAV